jgi:hypothetical protein
MDRRGIAMAALNQKETDHLSASERAMSDSWVRMLRARDAEEAGKVTFDLAEVDFMIDSLKKAQKLVNTVKQMKGYYPK